MCVRSYDATKKKEEDIYWVLTLTCPVDSTQHGVLTLTGPVDGTQHGVPVLRGDIKMQVAATATVCSRLQKVAILLFQFKSL